LIRLFDEPEGHRRLAGKFLGDGSGLSHEPVRGDHSVDDPDTVRFLSVQWVARQADLFGPVEADETGQSLSAPGARDDAEVHLGLAESCVLGRDRDITSLDQFASGAERKAVHRGDDWLRGPLDASVEGLKLLGEPKGSHRSEPRELADVRPGHERPVAGAGEDDDADRGVALNIFHHLRELAGHFLVHRVQHPRPVEGHRGNSVRPFCE
jgi:hypothetical protein